MPTTAYWLTVPAPLLQSLPFSSEEKINGLSGGVPFLCRTVEGDGQTGQASGAGDPEGAPRRIEGGEAPSASCRLSGSPDGRRDLG